MRAGARRALAERIVELRPDVLAVSEIDDGDALAVATQFGYQWAYRGGQALFWNERFVAGRVEEAYLPAPPLQTFERRGLLRVDGRCGSRELSLLTTRFSTGRARVRELRLTRTVIRETRASRIVLVIANPPASEAAAFRDLGFIEADACATASFMLAARNCRLREISKRETATDGVGPHVAGTLTV